MPWNRPRHQRLARAGGVADAEGEQGLRVLCGVRDPTGGLVPKFRKVHARDPLRDVVRALPGLQLL